jgi:hypothetical protein
MQPSPRRDPNGDDAASRKDRTARSDPEHPLRSVSGTHRWWRGPRITASAVGPVVARRVDHGRAPEHEDRSKPIEHEDQQRAATSVPDDVERVDRAVAVPVAFEVVADARLMRGTDHQVDVPRLPR